MTSYSFAHLLRISTDIGTFEHADHSAPRVECGFCTDDMARVLIVVSREPEPSEAVVQLGRIAYRFVADAQSGSGESRNRRSATGQWEDEATVEDCWGRSLWAFGTAARLATEESIRERALTSFERGAQQRSPWPRSMAFAALGAADVLAAHPNNRQAHALLEDTIVAIGPPAASARWPWPQARLSYANAALPDALIAAGAALQRPKVLHDGLLLLRWLLARETLNGHLSPTPVAGSGPDETAPRFDQQPIEIATMADACLRASTVDDDGRWLAAVKQAAAWFAGDNDIATPMQDAQSGGGFDGLTPNGPNQNCGAESTLAMMSTLQVAARMQRGPG